jgi:hypothetical protein
VQDFAVEVIYDVQQAERPSIPKTVRHEVYVPHGVGLLRFEKGLFNMHRKPLLSLRADVQSHSFIYSLQLFMVLPVAHTAYPDVV